MQKLGMAHLPGCNRHHQENVFFFKVSFPNLELNLYLPLGLGEGGPHLICVHMNGFFVRKNHISRV